MSSEEQESNCRPTFGTNEHPRISSIGATPAAAANDLEWSKPWDLVYLFLGFYKRVPLVAWEFLTIRELMTLPLLSHTIRKELRRVEYSRCRDGRDYLVPFPGFPGVLSTPQDLKNGAGLFQHQLASLEAMYRAENSHNFKDNYLLEDGSQFNQAEFGSLRGGILGDAPGLGKTITMLSLIASTTGVRPIDPPEFWDQAGIDEGWKLLRSNTASRYDILDALKPIRRWVMANLVKRSSDYKAYLKLEHFVSPPYEDGRLQTIQEFERHVKKTLRSFVPQSELELFRKYVVELRATLDKRNRKYISGSRKQLRIAYERSLVPTSATLIVVPDALLEHWFQQIDQHVNLGAFADENESPNNNSGTPRGVVYLDGIGDLADVVNGKIPLRSQEKDVQPAWHLSKFLMVVTTFSRCDEQYRTEVAAGRVQNSESNAIGRGRTNKRSRNASNEATGDPSPLLQMRWLRIVVDEGHELGTHEAGSNVTRFINQVAAERRWVMSGTPMTGDEDDFNFSAKGLDQLQRLLFFLRHPKYGTIPSEAKYKSPYIFADENDGDDEASRKKKIEAKGNWTILVKDPFLAEKGKGRQALLHVLRGVMVMHGKEDINLPKPIFKQGEETIEIDQTVQNAIIKSTHPSKCLSEYLETETFQGLVDEAQAKYIVDAIREAQKALTKRGGVEDGPDTVIAEYDNMNISGDRRPIKAVVYSSEEHNLTSVAEHLYRQLGPENIAEMNGGMDEMSAELARFRRGKRECRHCPVCTKANSVSSRHPFKCQNLLLEVVTKTQPQFRFLIEPERIMKAYNTDGLQNRLIGLPPDSSYNKNSSFWSVNDTLLVDVRDKHPCLPKRRSKETWEEFGSNRCKALAAWDSYEGRDWFFGPLSFDVEQEEEEDDEQIEEEEDDTEEEEEDTAEEVHDEEEEVEEDRFNGRIKVTLVKWQKCGDFHNHARWYGGPKLADVEIKTVEDNPIILCLNAEVATGLDLSFATHIFLLEPIDDAALLEQVTSRAHRLGATGPVCVETVHTWYELGPNAKAAIQNQEDVKDASASQSILAKQKRLTKAVVCQFCFRQFDSFDRAEEHERIHCPRNPESTNDADLFHLSSVYREIRPPPPLKTTELP